MAVCMCKVFMLTFLVFLTGVSGVSPVQKVIMLVDDMAGKVQKEIDDSTASFTENAKFCDEEVEQKSYAMKESRSNIEKLSAVITDESAKTEGLEAKISDLSTQISEAEKELAEAVSLREKAHADFVAIESELVNTVQKLDGTSETIKKSLSLSQLTPAAKKALDAGVQALVLLVDASFVTHAQRSKVQAYIQAQEDSEDSEGLLVRSGSGNAILDTLEEMMDKAETTLADTRKAEAEKVQAYMLLKQGMENEIKSLKEELAESTHAKQVATEASAQAGKDLAVEKKGLSSDTAYTGDLKHECSLKAQEFEVDTRDGFAELKALKSAKEILTKKFAGALVQTSASHKLRFSLRAKTSGESGKARALRLIMNLGKRVHSTALVSLAYRAAADPFVKIRGMVEEMIAKLMQEAAEEADQKAFCDKEMGESKKSKADKEAKLEKVSGRIEKAESAIAELSEKVTILSKEIAEIDAAVTEATAIRNEEKAKFMLAEKEFAESEEACAAALEVLREYYEGASLVQVRATSRASSRATARATTMSADQAAGGAGIISVLEVAESDFAKLLADARSTESVAQDEYDKMMQESKMDKATKEMNVKGKQSEMKQLKTSLSENGEDKAALDTELQAILDYLDKLKPKCETQVPSYAEIKAKRDAEIEGLKEALATLAA